MRDETTFQTFPKWVPSTCSHDTRDQFVSQQYTIRYCGRTHYRTPGFQVWVKYVVTMSTSFGSHWRHHSPFACLHIEHLNTFEYAESIMAANGEDVSVLQHTASSGASGPQHRRPHSPRFILQWVQQLDGIQRRYSWRNVQPCFDSSNLVHQSK